MVKIYIDGIFDLFHRGHLESLKQAKFLKDNVFLSVGVISDKVAKGYKRLPIISEDDRIEIIKAIIYVDEVITDPPLVVTKEFVKENNIDIVLPIHPRTKKMLINLSKKSFSEIESNQQIQIISPVSFLDMISLEKNASLIITDSGGVQKEAYFFKKPCVILREQTEWVEIVENGNAVLTGSDYNKIKKAVSYLLHKTDFTFPELFGDGAAGKFICSKILSDL